MPEQPIGAPALPDDFDESQPGLPFRRPAAPAVVDPRSEATPLGSPGEFMTDPAVTSAAADWNAAVGPGRLVPDPSSPGNFITPDQVPAPEGVEVVE